jgi:Spy/CpxP family protein refolding chaperone
MLKQESLHMMVLRKSILVIFFSLILLPGRGILAQDQTPHPGEPPESQEEKEKIRENIETLRMWKLLEALDLSSEQSMQFLPLMKQFQDARKRFEEKRKQYLTELEKALESEEKDEKKIKENLDALEKARNDFHQEMNEFFEQTKSILTLEQRARMHLFEERFERRLKDTIHRMRHKGSHWKGQE